VFVGDLCERRENKLPTLALPSNKSHTLITIVSETDTVKEYIASIQSSLALGEKWGAVSNKRLGQRQELLAFFIEKLGKGYEAHTGKKLRKGSFAYFVSHLKVKDLYYLKSICLDSENRGGSFAKTFWGSLKPR
jgi:hypothetical protein